MNRLSNGDGIIRGFDRSAAPTTPYDRTAVPTTPYDRTAAPYYDESSDNIVINIDDYLIGSEPSDSDIELGSNDDVDGDSVMGQHNGMGLDLDLGSVLSRQKTEWGVTYKKLSYNDVRDYINKSYEQDIVHRYSSALDILASYVKGQKTIYMETRTHIVTLLNFLMFPALFLSGLITVLQGAAIESYVLAGLSALVTFLLAIINYCKLEGAAEAHKTSSYQYDKLQSFIEFQSGQVLLFSNPILNNENMTRYCEKEKQIIAATYNADEASRKEAENTVMNAVYQDRLRAENELIQNMRDHMVRIESDISDIKETNQFIVPQKIRYNYPLLYNTNVFSIIKKIDDYRAKTLTELKNIKNELRYISAYMKKHGPTEHFHAHGSAQTLETFIKYKKRSNDLFQEKKKTINTILFLNTAFSIIDKMFQQEILNAKLRSSHRLRFFFHDLCCCVLPSKYIEPEMSGGDIFADILGGAPLQPPLGGRTHSADAVWGYVKTPSASP